MKKRFQILQTVVILTLVFWFAYTVTFLFIDGWHIKPAEGSLEAVFDSTTEVAFTFCFYYFFYCLFFMMQKTNDIMDAIYELGKEIEKYEKSQTDGKDIA